MAFFSFTLVFSLVLGISMVVSRINPPNCTVGEIKRHYGAHISFDLKKVEKNCTGFLNDIFDIKIGNNIYNNTRKGFVLSALGAYNSSQVLDSIFQHAKDMPSIPLIPPRESTIDLLKQCVTPETAMHQRGKRSRHRRNVFSKHVCLEIMGLHELWRIFRAHPDLRDKVHYRHTKSK